MDRQTRAFSVNSVNVPITYLKGPVPPGPIIRGSALAHYFDAASILEQARRQAKTLLACADEQLADATRDAAHIRAQARIQGIADANAQIEASRAALIEETIQWCVAESSLETRIAARLDSQIRAVLAQALAEFAAEQDVVEPLMRRVRERLQQCIEHPTITLRVAADALEAAHGACAAGERTRRVHVVADCALKATQAVIETPFVTIHLDLDLHLESVLTQLRATDDENVHHAR
jgi:flagellar biosynthesis/type III secretory pathway protein FliH